jgi:hexosaminidase
MIDTARHYLPKSAILRTLDAMQFNKLNVMHIHITDDESFPIWLESIPEIPETATFSSSQKYMPADIKEIVDKATENGIRIIPEIDSPGHSRSWGLSE